MRDVKIGISADGGAAFKVFEQFANALKKTGQAGREFSKIDFSHPEMQKLADTMRVVNAEYEMLLKTSKSLRHHVKTTGQEGVAPWDLDVGKWHTNMAAGQRQREALARRLLRNTGLQPPGGGSGQPPGGAPGQAPGGGGGIPSIPGLGTPSIGGLLKFTLGLAGLGGIASMAKQGVGQAQQEAIKLDPLYRMLQSTVESFGQLRDTTHELGRGLGVTYEQSVQLGSEFARLSGSADTAGMARGTRTGIGMARGLGMDPGAGVSFMARSRMMGLYSGSGERQFAAMIAAGVRQGGMQTMPDKVLQSVDTLATTLARSGVDAKGQIADMLAFTARMNASGNPALRGDFGQSIISRITQGIQSPGAGEAGEFFMYRMLGIANPFKSALAREAGPFYRGEDGLMTIEKILRQRRAETPGDPDRRAVETGQLLGIPGHIARKIDELFGDKISHGIALTDDDMKTIQDVLGGNEGAETLRLMTGIHDALTVAGGAVLGPLNDIRGALEYMAKLVGYAKPQEPPEASGKIERSVLDATPTGVDDKVAERIRRAITRESNGDPKLAAVLDATARLESNYSPRAGLGTDHVGLFQLSAATARRFGIDPKDRTDIEKSVHAAAEYLKFHKQKFGRWDLAGGAYVSGEGGMQAYLDGKSSEVGPITQRRIREIGALGLDPTPLRRDANGRFALDVTIKTPSGGKVEHSITDVGTPQASGRAALVVQ